MIYFILYILIIYSMNETIVVYEKLGNSPVIPSIFKTIDYLKLLCGLFFYLVDFYKSFFYRK